MVSLLISSDFPPIPGGQSKYLYNIWNNLPKDKIYILAPKVWGFERIDSQNDFHIKRVSLPIGDGFIVKIIKSFLILFHAIKIIISNKVDAIHCGQAFSAGFAGYLCYLIFGIPYITYVHGADFLEFKDKIIFGNILHRILRDSRKVIVNSGFTREAILRDNIKPEDIIVITPPVDPTLFRCSIEDIIKLRERLDLNDKKVLLTVSRLVERKGHDYTLKSLPKIIKNFPNLKYLIVGEGNYRKVLEKMVEELNLKKHVSFIGFVSDEELPKYYMLCDLFVMVSREIIERGDVEGFGIVYLEANAAGKAVVAGRSGRVADAVKDGVNGILLDPLNIGKIAEGITRLLVDNQF